MSSICGDWICSECKSTDAVNENFNDSETGHISECYQCGYMEVYRENNHTGKVIEDYQGFNHYYNKEKSDE